MNQNRAGVEIRQPWDIDGIEFVFYQKQGNKLFAAKPVKLEFVEISESETTPFTFVLPRHIAEDFVDELYKALTDFGKKSDGEQKLSGKLEATQYHLEDLRKLLKLKI